jgi:hypothetical protein
MRKLLLVMLVPILVLGVMGCGNKIDADTQTDYPIQGAWIMDDYTVYINAATMVVKYYTDVSTPYRTEWSREGDFKAGEVIEGELTVFGYKDNVELATLPITYTPGTAGTPADPDDPESEATASTAATLLIGDYDFEVEEFYYANAFPKPGLYTDMYFTPDAEVVDYVASPTDFVVNADGSIALSASGIKNDVVLADYEFAYVGGGETWDVIGDVPTPAYGDPAVTYTVYLLDADGAQVGIVGTFTKQAADPVAWITKAPTADMWEQDVTLTYTGADQAAALATLFVDAGIYGEGFDSGVPAALPALVLGEIKKGTTVTTTVVDAGDYTVAFTTVAETGWSAGTGTLAFTVEKAEADETDFEVTAPASSARPAAADFAAASTSFVTLGAANVKITIVKVYLATDTATKTDVPTLTGGSNYVVVFDYDGDDNYEAAEGLELPFTATT